MTQTAEILIIGAGFSGLIMAMEARKQGFSDIAILEKAQEIGGTWRDNTYPGVACDVPSHLYCFADHPNPYWTTSYAGGAEIQAYVRDVATREGLYELCHFGQELQAAQWDGQQWQVTTKTGQHWQARVLVSAIGALHVPAIPNLPGIDSFKGPHFHSAHWEHGVDLAGKTVAVVGTGASAIQFVPEIAKTAGKVTIFQRTAPYVLPRPDGPIAPWMQALHAKLPLTGRVRRAMIFRLYEMRHGTFVQNPRAVKIAMKFWQQAVRAAFPDPADHGKLTPPYEIGCKRILSSNTWYPALARDNVDLIPFGVDRIDNGRIMDRNGALHDVDVLIWGTGFHVTDAMDRIEITGPEGLTLKDAWRDGLKAHLGTAVAGFPNLFFLLGPHTGLGHNSVVLMIEAQAEHLGRVLAQMRRDGIPAIMPRADAQARFEAEVQDRLAQTVWQTGGCASWYQDAEGRNTTLWPGTVAEFQKRMADAGLSEYAPLRIPAAD